MKNSITPGTRCPQCGFDNPSGFAFCGRCGTPLTEQVPAAPPIQNENQPDLKAERRQLTVMFCDLVGSTALSEQLDPEDLREVMLAYRDVCSKVISRFEGYIAQFLGDGLLVYFGYPVAHEDDAHRAVRTGLGIVGAIKNLNPVLEHEKGLQLAVRIGIHTGLVVAGDMGTGAQLQPKAIVGETPNVAARVQSLAETDSVVISQATYRLIQGYFNCRSTGAHTLKGISKPVEVFQVLTESTARTRLDVAAATGFTPLVGRDKELQSLISCWEQAKGGRGQVALLSGEAGIGKSRMVHMLKEKVAQETGAWLTPCQCLAYYQNSALYPIIDVLERVAIGFERDDTYQQKLSKLEGWLVQYGFSLPETMPLIASLLSIPLSDDYTPLNAAPEQIKRKTFQTLLTVLLKLATFQPLLFVMEDLHWADSSTLEFLGLLIDQAPAVHIFLLLTFRPEFAPPWAVRPYMTHFALNRLPHRQTEALIEQLTKNKALPAEVLKELVMKTDGVPLFVEELTKMVLESGLLKEESDRYELAGPLPPLSIPATLQDSLLARLDKLATVKDVLQLAATIGQEFTYDLLRAVSSQDDVTLQFELSRLVGAELLYQNGFPPEARYVFKHALIRDSAYQQQLRSKRQISHQRIAQVVEKEFSNIVETQPELVAYHYTEAGLIKQAIPYWLKAGRQAIQRSANVEAMSHLTKGIELLQKLEETPERLQQELEFELALGPALHAIKGFSAPEAKQTYARAVQLCQQLGESKQLFSAEWGLWLYHSLRAEYQTARGLGEHLLTVAHRTQDRADLLQAHHAMWATLFWPGDIVASQKHTVEGLALYDPVEHRSHTFLYGGHNPRLCGLGFGSLSLWMMGYPEQALRQSEEALLSAEELAHPHSSGLTLTYATILRQFCRDSSKVQSLADRGIALSNEHRFPQWLALETILKGWALVEQGLSDGITQIHEGLAKYETIEGKWARTYFFALLADANLKMGQGEAALNALNEALRLLNSYGEHLWEGEIYRLRGELMLAQNEDTSEAEQEFRQAATLARHQGAKSLELRAVMSLCRMWQQRGKTSEARNMLTEIYGWFTEGFDTAELQDAKLLLETLS